MSLLHIPHPTGGREPRREMPLGPMPEPAQARTPEQKRADDRARWEAYRQARREQINARQRARRAAKKRKSA